MIEILKEIFYNIKSLNIKAEDAYLMTQILDNLENIINNLYLQQQNNDKKE